MSIMYILPWVFKNNHINNIFVYNILIYIVLCLYIYMWYYISSKFLNSCVFTCAWSKKQKGQGIKMINDNEGLI